MQPVRDVAIVGAGAAGLGLAAALARRGVAPSRVALLETPYAALRSPRRTWCSWQAPDAPQLHGAVSAAWERATVIAHDGTRIELDLPVPYVMVRSDDYARAVEPVLRAAGVDRLALSALGLRDSPDEPYAVVRAAAADGAECEIQARWVFDTRPPRLPAAVPAGRTRLLQHFRGWFVRAARDVFDPGSALLMDFRVPQPPDAVAFGYVLATTRREALVEYTEFSRAPLSDAGYDAALRHYVGTVLGLGSLQVRDVEQGVIPMTDEPLPRRAGPRTFRLGAAGGATRPSTGYTFAAAQRQAVAVADALRAGREPVPPPAYPARHRAMDSLVLRALDTGRVDGASFLAGLFAAQPVERVLRFLDGRTTPAEDLAVMRSAPRAPMLATVTERLLHPGA